MSEQLTAVLWIVITAVVCAFSFLAIGRPWRFLRSRTYCPQCKKLLPRWDRWGWAQVWICSRCGCQVGR